ncbi:hypothetical protein D3C80_1737730 [compost metagenome]
MAMGGLPITLTNKIEKEINRWKSAGITPVFVFNGISHKKVDVGPSPIKAHTFVVAEELERKRRSAFNAFERGQVKEASALFSMLFFVLLLLLFVIWYFSSCSTIHE